MGKAYNPDDYLCQICVYKSCLHKSRGREILREKVLEMKNKEKDNSFRKEEIFNFCKIADKDE